jgi:hypothetical protein
MLAHWGLRIPLLVCVLGACSVYDDSLLSSSPVLASGAAGLSGAEAGTAGGSGSSAGLEEPDAGAAGNLTSGGEGGSVAGAGAGGAPHAGAGAGGSPAGGSAGTAGGGVVQAGSAGAAIVLALEQISNMETGTTIDQSNGRNGDFYAGHDLTAGTQFPGAPFVMSALPTTDPRYSSSDKMAAMTNGMGFTDWGENIGFNLNLVNGTTGKHPLYDASAYCGFHFFAKVGASPASTRVLFRVTEKYSLPDGGTCGLGGQPPCYHYFQKQFDFTPAWQEKSVLFTDLTCLDCQKTALDPKVLFGVEFGLPPNAKFEFWFDDMSFLKKPISGMCPESL